MTRNPFAAWRLCVRKLFPCEREVTVTGSEESKECPSYGCKEAKGVKEFKEVANYCCSDGHEVLISYCEQKLYAGTLDDGIEVHCCRVCNILSWNELLRLNRDFWLRLAVAHNPCRPVWTGPEIRHLARSKHRNLEEGA